MEESYRLYDRGKVVGACDGYFEPSEGQRDVLHPDKTKQDYMPVADRPRVIEAKARAKRMQG